MAKTLDLAQTVALAAFYRTGIFRHYEAHEDSEGRTAKHMVWMCERVMNDKAMTLDKASRWIGYVQAYLVLFQQYTLDELKAHVRRAKGQ